MAEQGGRSAKYEYRAAANLVLESDRDKRARNEPSGAAESLAASAAVPEVRQQLQCAACLSVIISKLLLSL
jgi:hypothetical protein